MKTNTFKSTGIRTYADPVRKSFGFRSYKKYGGYADCREQPPSRPTSMGCKSQILFMSAAELQQMILMGARSRSESRSGDPARSSGRESPIGPLVLYERPPHMIFDIRG